MAYFNTKIKLYDDSNYNITYCNLKIFNDVPKKKKKYNNKSKKNKKIKSEPTFKNISRSVKRAKERIFDIVYLNDWDYFLTFTFNPSSVDSYNKKEVMKIVSTWFNNQRRYNNMLYLLVPEFHKNKRIHIHALIKGGNLKLSNSGKFDDNKNVIFNVNSWEYG